MDAWMALVSIISIVAVVLIAAGLIAFIGHIIIGAIDTERKSTANESQKGEVIDYAKYKQLEDVKQNEQLAVVDENLAKAEEAEANSIKDEVFGFVEKEESEDNLAELEKRLAEEREETAGVAEKVAEVPEQVPAQTDVEDEEVEDVDALLDEISNDVIDEAKEEAQQENVPTMSEELESYTIDDYLTEENENEVEETETPEEDEEVETVETEEVEAADEVADEADVEEDEEVEEIEQTEEIVPAEDIDRNAEIESLRAQLADLNRQLEEARNAKVEVVTINMTEDECVARLATIEERLKNARKDYKTNLKEYRPLKKVMNDLDRYQTKLRRKEAIVAKKKVALYGVNNYVDIDKEKAEKLANELELLEGLRLSVSHCEEVINANKDRYPILEHTNKILEDEIAHLEADKLQTETTLQRIREQNGNGENEGEGANE